MAPRPWSHLSSRATGLLATFTLLLVTATWGSTFFLIKDLLARVPVLDFLALRFAIATLALLVIFPRAVGRLSPRARRAAVVLGALYGLGQILQTAGLAHTPATVSGFITGMYVVCTPLFAAPLLKQKIDGTTWFAVLLAVVGLGVLSLSGVSLGYGEMLTLIAAMLYALHIVGLGAWSRPGDAIGLTILQLAVITLMSLVATAPNGIVLPTTAADWMAILYMALVAAALALVGQTWAQAHLPPTRAAIIMTTEPVFAALFAVLFGGESMTTRMLLGGALVVAAMLLVEVRPRRKFEAEVTHIAG